jgi:molybdopterin-guanine dinucleotide biosynthesis protein A
MMGVAHPDAAAAILAGGHARRFGGLDKSRLVVGGRTIIARQLDVLQHVAGEVFVVGPTDGRFADLHVAVHADVLAGCGALGGLHAALAAARADRVLVVACDLPFLEVAVMSRLVGLVAGHDAAWVRGPRGPEPLVACYDRRVLGLIGDRLASGERRVGDLEHVLRIAWLDEAELTRLGSGPQMLANLNTPDDHARVQYRTS